MYVSPKELSSLLSFVLVSRAAHPLVGVATLAAGGSRSVDENSVDPLAGPERRDADGQGVAVDEQVDGRGDAHEGVTEERRGPQHRARRSAATAGPTRALVAGPARGS